MKRQPLVSIIIPVYNAEQYLKECIDSVWNQTYENLDIVLVDDGSKDNSPKMCDKFARKDGRIQVIHKENGGLVSAWKAGVEKAKGDYVVFLDSDDWIDLFMIEDMVNHATGKGKEIVCGNYIIEKENQSIAMKQSLEPDVYDISIQDTEQFVFRSMEIPVPMWDEEAQKMEYDITVIPKYSRISKVPETGDTFGTAIICWGGVAMFSVAGIVLLLSKKK